MIVYSAVVPHSPLLAPNIGKGSNRELEKTRASFSTLAQSLDATAVETLLVIAPHEQRVSHDTLCIHLPSRYHGSLQEFGDLITKVELDSDPVLADKIKTTCKEHHIEMMYDSASALEYSTTIPLILLTTRKTSKIIVLSPPDVSSSELYTMGIQIQRPLQATDKRIGCIVSGDLARYSSNAPLQEIESAAIDAEIITALKMHTSKKITRIDQARANAFHVCGMQSFSLFLGVMKHIQCKARLLSYERPYGVGQAVISYTIT